MMNPHYQVQPNEQPQHHRAVSESTSLAVSEFPCIETALVRQSSLNRSKSPTVKATTTAPSSTTSSTTSSIAPDRVEKRRLPSDFTPTPYTVLCGRGRECFDSVGNRRFRVLVHLQLERYAMAATKAEKSRIVSDVVAAVRKSGGSFVNKEPGDGNNVFWLEVGDAAAREKVGAQFRDCLHMRYKSASKCKSARRKQERRRNGGGGGTDLAGIRSPEQAGEFELELDMNDDDEDVEDDSTQTTASVGSQAPAAALPMSSSTASPSRRCSLFDESDDGPLPEDLGEVSVDMFGL